MTTSVKIHVNGRYRATVQQDGNLPVIVEGNYEGSPNPSGEHSIYVCHPCNTVIRIAEEQVPEEPAAAVEAPAAEEQVPEEPAAPVEAPAAEAKPAPEADLTI